MTTRLYIEDEYLKEFDAKVISISEVKDSKFEVILDATAFYPEKGGQPSDLGYIGDAKVLDVVEKDEDVIHIVDRVLEKAQYHCKIDWDRRFENMQQHAGQHLLAAAFLKKIDGYTVSMHIGSEINTIDVDKENISDDEVCEVEKLANTIIYENRDINKFIVDKEGAAKLPLRKTPKVDTNIRIVEIKDFDMSPCGGTHVKKTGEIGIIKIIKHEKYKKMTRIEFLCGVRALRDYDTKNSQAYTISNLLSSKVEELVSAVEKSIEDKNKLESTIRQQNQNLLDLEIKQIVFEAKKVKCNLSIITFKDKTIDDLRYMAEKLASEHNMNAIFGIEKEKKQIVVSKIDALDVDLGKKMREVPGVRGGGKGNLFQGVIDDFSHLDEIAKIFIHNN